MHKKKETEFLEGCPKSYDDPCMESLVERNGVLCPYAETSKGYKVCCFKVRLVQEV